MAVQTLNDLFVHTLRDIYYAEKHAAKGMRKMERTAQSDELKQAIAMHREETQGQIENLEKVFEMLGMRTRGVKCEAIEGIVSEAEEIMEEVEDPVVRDAAIVSAIQAVEHYEITRYGTMIAWAEALGQTEAIVLLQEILQQEVATDEKLTQLAKSSLNEMAKGRGDEVEDEEDGGGTGGRKSSRGKGR